MRLIDDVHLAWTYWSVRLSALGTLIFAVLLAAPDQALALWTALPPELQAYLPNAKVVGLILTAAAGIARVVKQGRTSPPAPVSSPTGTS